MKNSFSFEIIAKDKRSKARLGRITTPRGTIKTPAFVPVGTKASVKSLTPQDLKEIGVEIFFGNTYHLYLSPGEKIVKEFGGLGKFMGWPGPIITDSGGFQVFSLGRENKRSKDFDTGDRENNNENKLVKITDNGVIFKSIIDGSRHEFTPEKSIQIQKDLGADIILTFDDCPPYPATHGAAKAAMERTHAWAVRCLAEAKQKFRIHNSKSGTNSNLLNSKSQNISNSGIRASGLDHPWQQALYGIVQGGVFEDLRRQSARFIAGLAFDGIGIGGVAVGESKQEMRKVLEWSIPYLPEEKPRHLLGVGEVDDIFLLVERGIDTFDCVIPSRIARSGFVFVSPSEGNMKNRFRIDIQKSFWKTSKKPLDENCDCNVCQNFTRGYLHHLFRNRELLAYRLASYHNIYFINSLIENIRRTILDSSFEKLKKRWLNL